MRIVRDWLEARRIDSEECPGAAMRLERLLRESAPGAQVPVPPTLRAGVYRRLDGTAPGLSWTFGWARWAAVPAMAALVALSMIPWPRTPAVRAGEEPAPLSFALDSRSVILPAAGYVDRPLLKEAGLIVKDTRRATALVMECLPRPGSRSGLSAGGG